MALVNKNAAVLIKDIEATDKLIPEALTLLSDAEKCNELSLNIASLGRPNATEDIVNQLEKIF